MLVWVAVVGLVVVEIVVVVGVIFVFGGVCDSDCGSYDVCLWRCLW